MQRRRTGRSARHPAVAAYVPPPLRLWSAAGLALVLGLGAVLGAVQPALAHAFSLVVVTDDATTAAEALRGLRLAVDQSPDVSHPRGREGGDHLGGIDVDIVVVEVADDGAAAAAARVRQLLDDGATAVVTLTAEPVARAVSQVTAAERVLQVTVDADDTVRDQQGSVVIRPRRDIGRSRARVAAFSAAFADAHGEPPADAALLGYDAGRLLDILVTRFGEHIPPGAPAVAVTREASRGFLVAEVGAGAPGATPTAVTMPVDDAAPVVSRGGILTAVATALVAVAAGVGIARSGRRSW